MELTARYKGADCPRRGVAPELDEEPLAAAAFLGESVPSNTCSKKTQCVHPDKPMMFACAALSQATVVSTTSVCIYAAA